MVRIALAGGSGGVGREILDALLETGKHDIIVISRKVSKQEKLQIDGYGLEETDEGSVGK